MQLNVIQQIAAIIHINYEGGMGQFRQDGGILEAVATEPPKIIICHPDMPQRLSNALVLLGKNIDVEVIISSKYNLAGLDPVEVQRGLDNVVFDTLFSKGKQLLCQVSACCLVFLAMEEIDEETIAQIQSSIKKHLPNVYRCLIAGANMRKFLELEPDPVTKVSSVSDSAHLNHPICEDDINNLRITLSTNIDVLDVIKNL